MTKTNKSLGQNFLRDEGILRKIVSAAEITGQDTVLEVGPGEGSLTQFLLEKAGRVIAVEKDAKLVELLKEKFKQQVSNKKLQIIEGDVLNLELEKISIANNFILVGNIPYYITGAIFRKFLESENRPKSITFVVQKEVAERIIARDKKESVLSISIKLFGTPEYGGIIKAGSFVPKPKVDSAIISIRDIGTEKLGEVSAEKFFKLVKLGFAHKRKLLIKNLGITKNVFDKCGINEKSRAENLAINDWVSLVKTL